LILPEGEVLVKKLLYHPSRKSDQKTIHTIIKDHKIKHWKWDISFTNAPLPDLTNVEMFFHLLKLYRESIKPQSKILIFKAWEIIHTLGKIPSDLLNKYNIRYFGLYRDIRAVASSQKLTIYKNKPLENNIVSATIKWKRFIRICRANDPMITLLKYEEMISGYNDFFRSFFKVCNMAWDPSMAVRSGKVKKLLPEDQIPLHQHIDQQPEPELIDQWKLHLSNEDIKIIQNHSSRELSSLGYEIIPVHTSIVKLIFKWTKYLAGYWFMAFVHPAHYSRKGDTGC
jgi:hypothetical protein